MNPADPITLSMVQVAMAVGGLMLAGAGVLAAVARWVMKQCKEETARVESRLVLETQSTHGRISQVRDECVRREDYHEDRRRMEALMASLEATVRTGFSEISSRIDRVYTNERAKP